MFTFSQPFLSSPLKHLLTVSLFLLVPGILSAQDASPSTLLPDIDPQDIEIRGDFEVRFPGIRRQPILGFNPRPRVFQIDPDRLPFLETPEQVVTSLPVSDLERPSPPVYTFYRHPDRFRLWSTTGIGNYMAPEADVYLEVPLSEKTTAAASVNHFSSADYLDSADGQTSSFRNLHGDLNLVHYAGERSRWQLNLNGRSDRNHLPVTSIAQADPAADPLISRPDNNIGVLGAQLAYRNTRNARSYTDLKAEYSSFNAETGGVAGLAASSADVNSFKEQLLVTAVEQVWTGSRPGNTMSVSAGASYGMTELAIGSEGNWLLANLGTTFRTRIGYQLSVEAGGRAYYGSDEVKDQQVLLYPEIRLQYRLSDLITLRGVLEGVVQNQGIHGISRVNRRLFMYTSPENERGVRFSGSAEYEAMDGLKVQSTLSYGRYTRMGAFALQPGTDNLLTQVYLDGGSVIRWETSTWYDLQPERIQAYGGFYVQSVTDRNGERVAFRENIGLRLGGVYRFTDQLRVHAWSDYTGSRRVAPGRSENGYLLLGVKADVWASKDIGAYIKITNMLNQSYATWTGYDELPAQVFGGIMIKL
ncbi:MAG: hypothetical protein HLUCCA01_06520 [Bacteroidetes bacterium HLUCCA01]|nr:MAG: hypothetical protein HLUCCA01_06520 [Bacteroidetes bacterium HLUCCA01]